MSTAAEGKADEKIVEELKQLREKFEAAMNDDLNTSVALSVVFELVRLANGLVEEGTAVKGTLDAVDDLFRKLGGDCLGIVRETYDNTQITVAEYDKLVNILIEQRNEARKRKDFTAADTIRTRLNISGIVLEDKPDGTEWRRK
jgi:cysteinyl-tRNA synthetase